jgi:glycosyltransferase involved in cell wall biosynthesis
VLVEPLRTEGGAEGGEMGSRGTDVMGVDDLRPARESSPGPSAEGGREREGGGVTPQRIRHLTSVHSIRDPRIFHKECKSLAALGHDVGLVACHDRAETIDGVRIVPVDPGSGRLDRMLRVGWRVYRAARRERADVYHFHDPELMWVGVLLKLGGASVIYDVHEDVPKQIMGKHWIPRWARPVVSKAVWAVEQAAARILDGIVAATPTIARKFPADRTAVVQNFPEAAFARRDGTETPWAERSDAFVYTGGLMEIQGVREMAQAFALLPEGMTGTVAGTFYPPTLEAEIATLPGWKRVRFLGQVPRTQVVGAMRAARIGIVLNHPTVNYVDAYPTKMFEYMASGLPVVCSNFPLWAEIVGGAECGIAVDPRDPAAIAAAIRSLAEDPERARRLGENGRRAIAERFNWEAELRKLEALYERVA